RKSESSKMGRVENAAPKENKRKDVASIVSKHGRVARMNSQEHIAITQALPGLDDALKELPVDWTIRARSQEGAPSRQELLEMAREATGLLVVGDTIDAQLLKEAPRLRAIAQYGVGTDNIDLKAARRSGVAVLNL